MKKIFSILMVAILAVGFMTGCSKKGGDFKMGEVQENGVVLKEGDTVAVFKVKDFGDIKVKLYKDLAPKTVENFTTHAKNGYYDNVTFHRVINEFMIQGGD
ncbi:MAG: peptidylprolyl isomerase, partial [Oscillospiraceae bacterium]